MTQTEPPLTLLSPRVAIPFAIVTLIWGSTWIVIRDQIGTMPPSWSVATRFAFASVAMFALAAWRREPMRLDARGYGFAFALGLFQFTLNFNLVYRAEAFITSGLVAVLFALLIVPNSLAGRFLLHRPLSRGFLLGAGIAILGIACMVAHEVEAGAVGGRAVLIGTTLTLAAVLCASAANIMQATDYARTQPMLTIIAWSMLFGVAINALIGLATAGPPPLFDQPARFWLGAAYLGIMGSAVTFPLYFQVIRDVGPGPAAWSSVLIPVIAMAISTLWEGYDWSLLAAAGGALTLIGLIVALRPARKV